MNWVKERKDRDERQAEEDKKHGPPAVNKRFFLVRAHLGILLATPRIVNEIAAGC
jgi:hypothetical protein